VAGEAKVSGISLNTERIQKGDLFMALPGKIHHGANSQIKQYSAA
jgi:hypothetical protein